MFLKQIKQMRDPLKPKKVLMGVLSRQILPKRQPNEYLLVELKKRFL